MLVFGVKVSRPSLQTCQQVSQSGLVLIHCRSQITTRSVHDGTSQAVVCDVQFIRTKPDSLACWQVYIVDRAPIMTAHVAQRAALRINSGTATRGCSVRLFDKFNPLRTLKPVALVQISPKYEFVCTVGHRSVTNNPQPAVATPPLSAITVALPIHPRGPLARVASSFPHTSQSH